MGVPKGPMQESSKDRGFQLLCRIFSILSVRQSWKNQFAERAVQLRGFSTRKNSSAEEKTQDSITCVNDIMDEWLRFSFPCVQQKKEVFKRTQEAFLKKLQSVKIVSNVIEEYQNDLQGIVDNYTSDPNYITWSGDAYTRWKRNFNSTLGESRTGFSLKMLAGISLTVSVLAGEDTTCGLYAGPQQVCELLSLCMKEFGYRYTEFLMPLKAEKECTDDQKELLLYAMFFLLNAYYANGIQKQQSAWERGKAFLEVLILERQNGQTEPGSIYQILQKIEKFDGCFERYETSLITYAQTFEVGAHSCDVESCYVPPVLEYLGTNSNGLEKLFDAELISEKKGLFLIDDSGDETSRQQKAVLLSCLHSNEAFSSSFPKMKEFADRLGLENSCLYPVVADCRHLVGIQGITLEILLEEALGNSFQFTGSYRGEEAYICQMKEFLEHAAAQGKLLLLLDHFTRNDFSMLSELLWNLKQEHRGWKVLLYITSQKPAPSQLWMLQRDLAIWQMSRPESYEEKLIERLRSVLALEINSALQFENRLQQRRGRFESLCTNTPESLIRYFMDPNQTDAYSLLVEDMETQLEIDCSREPGNRDGLVTHDECRSLLRKIAVHMVEHRFTDAVGRRTDVFSESTLRRSGILQDDVHRRAWEIICRRMLLIAPQNINAFSFQHPLFCYHLAAEEYFELFRRDQSRFFHRITHISAEDFSYLLVILVRFLTRAYRSEYVEENHALTPADILIFAQFVSGYVFSHLSETRFQDARCYAEGLSDVIHETLGKNLFSSDNPMMQMARNALYVACEYASRYYSYYASANDA